MLLVLSGAKHKEAWSGKMASILEKDEGAERSCAAESMGGIVGPDAQRLRSLVRANLTNLDRLTLERVVAEAYQLGSEGCHRAMKQYAFEPQPTTLAAIEQQAIERTFLAMEGSIKATARILGIGKTTLYRKLHDYGILDRIYEHCPNCGCELRIAQLRKRTEFLPKSLELRQSGDSALTLSRDAGR